MSENRLMPKAQGLRMPAEWEPHEGTYLSWPYNPLTWEGHLEGAEQAYVDIIRALVPHETVHLLVPDAKVHERALQSLREGDVPVDNLVIHVIESGDVWIRDYGPIFVTGGEPARRCFTKWIYNAYGNKYEDLLIGNEVPDKLDLSGCERFDTGLVLEGGAIDVNGSGSLLTTESCLLSPDRNPHLSKEEIERALEDYLGVTNVLWLEQGIAGDDTTGHVDDVARFVDGSTVVIASEEDPQDENYEVLFENRKRLAAMKDEQGRPLTVIPLPMPRPLVVEGRRMAATYANFYIANNVVLMPAYAQPSDEEARNILQNCFPDRRIIPIDSRELIWGYGSIHCATQQIPL